MKFCFGITTFWAEYIYFFAVLDFGEFPMNDEKILEVISSLDKERPLKDYLDDLETNNNVEFNACLTEFQNTGCNFTTTQVQTLLKSVFKFLAHTKLEIDQDGGILNIGKWLKVFRDQKSTSLESEVYVGGFQSYKVEVKHVKDLSHGAKEIENLVKFAQHPNIAQLIGYDFINNIESEHAGYYICMEYGTRLCHKQLTPTKPGSPPTPSTMENLK